MHKETKNTNSTVIIYPAPEVLKQGNGNAQLQALLIRKLAMFSWTSNDGSLIQNKLYCGRALEVFLKRCFTFGFAAKFIDAIILMSCAQITVLFGPCSAHEVSNLTRPMTANSKSTGGSRRVTPTDQTVDQHQVVNQLQQQQQSQQAAPGTGLTDMMLLDADDDLELGIVEDDADAREQELML